MLNRNYSSELLDLEDVIVTNIENFSDGLFSLLELPRRPHACPDCGRKTNRVYDYRRQLIKDIPLGRKTYLILRKRRYRCTCGKRFFEKSTFLPRYYRATRRLVAAIISAFENVLSAEMIARPYNVSSVIAMRYFRCVSPKLKTLPEVLSIDEFKGNAGGEKYNTILVDPKNKRVSDILPDRYESHLIQHFKQFESKMKVKYFICDMNPHFRNVSKVYFPKAKIVADRYHVIRQVNRAMERVRKNE